jgi:hypothetical protein
MPVLMSAAKLLYSDMILRVDQELSSWLYSTTCVYEWLSHFRWGVLFVRDRD